MFPQHVGVLLVVLSVISARRLREGGLEGVDPSEQQCVDAVVAQAVSDMQAEHGKSVCKDFEDFSKKYGREEHFEYERIANAQAWHVDRKRPSMKRSRTSLTVMAEIGNIGTKSRRSHPATRLQADFKAHLGEAAHQIRQGLNDVIKVRWPKCREDAQALNKTLCNAFAGACDVEVVSREGDDGHTHCRHGRPKAESHRFSEDGRITPRYDPDDCDALCPIGLYVIRSAGFCSRMCSLHARGIPVQVAASCCTDKVVATSTATTTAPSSASDSTPDTATPTATTTAPSSAADGTPGLLGEQAAATTPTAVSQIEPQTATPAATPDAAATTTPAAITPPTATTTTSAINPIPTPTAAPVTPRPELKPMSPSYIEELVGQSLDERFSHFLRHWVDTGSSGEYLRTALRDVVLEFRSFMDAIEVQSPDDVTIVPPFARDEGSLRLSRLLDWKPSGYRQQAILHNTRSRLRQRMRWSVYQAQSLAGQRVLVCGSGPGGLRTAIEARLHGAEVVVVESREYMTRANVLVIWDWTKEDLYSLGMKEIYPDFAVAPDKQTVPIGFVQHALLRVALIIGVDIRPGCTFVNFEKSGQVWAGRTRCAMDPHSADEPWMELVNFDMVVDASGTRAKSKGAPGSQDVTGKGPLLPIGPVASKQYKNYAVTVNFKRFRNDHRDAFGISQQFRLELFRKKKVLLDNIVYYSAPSHHYVVATVKDEVLRDFGVVNEIQADLLQPGNVNHDKLKELVNVIAEDWDIPRAEGFFQEGPQSDGNFKDSFAIFEFSKLVMADFPLTLMPRESDEERPQVLAAVGDALMSPFWPEGTGANRAMIGSMQQTDNFIRLVEAFKVPQEPSRQTMVQEAEHMARQRYKALKGSAGGDVSVCSYQSFVQTLYAEREPADVWTEAWSSRMCRTGQETGPLDER